MTNKRHLILTILYLTTTGFSLSMEWRSSEILLNLDGSTSPEMKKKLFEDAQNGIFDIHDIENYLSEGGTIRDAQKHGTQLIHLAAAAGRIDILTWLHERSADINARNYRGERPIHFAAQNGNIEVLDWLYENDAHINVKDGNNSRYPIHFAAQAGQIQSLQWFYEHGDDINKPDRVGYQPVHLAAIAGKVDALAWLHANGANVYALSKDGHGVIHLAADAGQVEVLKWFSTTSTGITALDRPGRQAVHYAAHACQWDALRWLRQNGADLNAACSSGSRPIHSAAYTCETDLREWLRQNGADINAVRNDGFQPIHLAAVAEHTNALRWLLDNGADIEALTKDGLSPTARAFTTSRFLPMILLIANGASIPDTLPPTLKELFTNECADCHSLPTITLLQKKNFLPSVEVTLSNSDIFIMAAGQGKINLVRYIIEHHATQLERPYWAEALIGAATAGHIDIVDLLQNHISEDDSLRDALPDALTHALVRAAAQGRQKVVEHIIKQYSDHLEGYSFIEALIRATVAGHIEIVKELRNKMEDNDNDALKKLLHEGLSRALVTAATQQGNFAFIQYLLAHGADPADAEEHLRKLLAPFSPAAIEAHPQLQWYHRTLNALAVWQETITVAATTVSDSSDIHEMPGQEGTSTLTSYLQLPPPEVLESILSLCIHRILFDIPRS